MAFVKVMKRSPVAASSRILMDIPCAVCQDHSSGKHYGVFVCDGCAGFFKRSVRSDRKYSCKTQKPGTCIVDKAHRNLCRACRFAKCFKVGMNKDSVQHERGPRNSTLCRQMALLINNTNLSRSDFNFSSVPNSVVDLSVPKQKILSQPLAFNYSTSVPAPLSLTHPVLLNHLSTIFPLQYKNPKAKGIYSLSARILSTMVVWAKNIPSFTNLSISDRFMLLEESWREIFTVTSAHILYPFNWKCVVDKNKVDLEDVNIFEEIILELIQLKPDIAEYGYLSGIALFKTSFEEAVGGKTSTKVLQDVAAVAALQLQSQRVFIEYTKQTYLWEPLRASKLLRLIQRIRQVPATTIAELFFKPRGDVSVESIIHHLYETNQSMCLSDCFQENTEGESRFGYAFYKNS